MVPTAPNGQDMKNNVDSGSALIRQVLAEITTISIPFVQFGVLKTGGSTTIGMYRSKQICMSIDIFSSTQIWGSGG